MLINTNSIKKNNTFSILLKKLKKVVKMSPTPMSGTEPKVAKTLLLLEYSINTNQCNNNDMMGS